METRIIIEFPLKRVAYRPSVGWWPRFYSWGGGSVQEFGGKRINITRHLLLFRWHVLTMHRNEYHDRSDAERADEYLRKWSECEKELRSFRLALLGRDASVEVKRVIKESFGIDLDAGRDMK